MRFSALYSLRTLVGIALLFTAHLRASAAPCTFCPGDTNANNKVDGDDAQQFITSLLAGDISNGCACADLDGDGSITQFDIDLFANALLVGTSQPPWPTYAGDARHQALSPAPAASLGRVLWSTPVDLQPTYSGDELLIHYGSPLISAKDTVIVTVKTPDGFRVEGHRAADGQLLWTQATDYVLPSTSAWTPSCGPALRSNGTVVIPGAGGTVYIRDADAPTAPVAQIAFYGLENYQSNPGTYASVRICTPITSTETGSLYFGFQVVSPTPVVPASGIAMISCSGTGIWISAVSASGDAAANRMLLNCAPAVSPDGQSVYTVVRNSAGGGYLVRLDSQTLTPMSRIRLRDVRSPSHDAILSDSGSAAPTVGPDGDVYIGVLEYSLNNCRGWLLHYDAALSQTKLPGAFGWDDTASLVPLSAVPQYAGPAIYLLFTKYNNYAQCGGNGVNKIAVLDPTVSMVDPISGATAMKPVITITAPTPDPDNIGPGSQNAVKEWCVNDAAVDSIGHCALVNNEDGHAYRWDFDTNTLAQNIILTSGVGAAYTPTLVGPDGVVYAISNAVLFAIGPNP